MWINHLRNNQTDAVHVLRAKSAQRAPIVVGDIVMLEVLQGMNSTARAIAMERWMRRFVLMPMLGTDLAVQAATNYRFLRSRGITIRKTADLIIGTFCLTRDMKLLHDDRDFDHMEQHLGLQVVHS